MANMFLDAKGPIFVNNYQIRKLKAEIWNEINPELETPEK